MRLDGKTIDVDVDVVPPFAANKKMVHCAVRGRLGRLALLALLSCAGLIDVI